MRTRGSIGAWVLILLSSLLGGPARAQFQQVELKPKDVVAWDTFGGALDIDSDVAVIGAPQPDNQWGVVGPGSAYVFRRTGGVWLLEAKLTAWDGVPGDVFGTSVAVSGDTVLVGATKDDDRGKDSGSVYVFRKGSGGWSLESKLTGSTATTGDRFGGVKLIGDLALIGASGDDTAGLNSGAIYVFRRSGTTWSEKSKLAGYHPGAFDGETLLSGDSSFDLGSMSDVGLVHVLRLKGDVFQLEATISNPEPSTGDDFGWKTALDGDLALVSAPGDSAPGLKNSGSVYVVHRSGKSWTPVNKLKAHDASAGQKFGWGLAMDGGLATVSFLNIAKPGKIYVFRRLGVTWNWNEEFIIKNGKGSTFDRFGWSVTLDGDTALVGAAGDPVPGTDAGSAYLATSLGEYAETELFGVGCGGPTLTTTSTPKLGGIVTLNLSGAVASSPAFFLVSAAEASLPVGGSCTLYLASPFLISPPLLVALPGSLTVSAPIPTDLVLVGKNVYTQFVVVDGVGPGSGTSWTAGLRLRFGL